MKYRTYVTLTGATRVVERTESTPEQLRWVAAQLFALIVDQAEQLEIPPGRFGWTVEDHAVTIDMSAWPDSEAFGEWFGRWAARNEVEVLSWPHAPLICTPHLEDPMPTTVTPTPSTPPAAPTLPPPPPGWRWKEDGHNTLETADGACYVGINAQGNVFIHAPKGVALAKSIQCGGADVLYGPFVVAVAFLAQLRPAVPVPRLR